MDPAAPPPLPHKISGVKRAIAAVVLWLVVGAVLTALSTWGGILLTHGWTWNPDLPVVRPDIAWPHAVDASWPRAPDLSSQVSSLWSDHAEYLAMPAGPNRLHLPGMVDHRGGWPIRSLCCWETSDAREHGAWIVNLSRFHVRRLPVVPIWPGFGLNTLFYAVLAWLIRRIPIRIRRHRRHRRRTRGLCVKCADNRAGLAPNAPCPECGHAPSATRAAASANLTASA